jgi:ComF family protein
MHDWVDRQVERLGGILLPPRCVLCGARGQAAGLDLCAGCEGSFAIAANAVQRGPAPLRCTFAPFAYAWPLDHLVQSLKYRGHLANARVLGMLLADRVARHVPDHAVNAIVPVPLHPRRHAGRGFNQSAEIARHVGRCLQLPVAESRVQRWRATPPQVGLHVEERQRNLADAFRASAVEGLRVAIVDDVTTTGATLRELARALLQAGALAVEGWCVAAAGRRGGAAEAAAVRAEPP